MIFHYFQVLQEIINLSFSKKYSYKNLKTKKNIVIVIGVGGSILGSKAIYSVLTTTKLKKKFIFIDNLSER